MINIEDQLYVAQFNDGSFFKYGTFHGYTLTPKGDYDIGKTDDLYMATKGSKITLAAHLHDLKNEEPYTFRKLEIKYELK